MAGRSPRHSQRGQSVRESAADIERYVSRGSNRAFVIVVFFAILALIFFVIIPVSTKIKLADDNAKRIEFIMDKFEANKDDPEVAQILKEYADEFGIAAG